MGTAIRIENLGKKYTITRQRQSGSSYVSLRDVLSDGAKRMAQRILSPHGEGVSSSVMQEFWALKDIHLEVEQGDKLAIIGHNGAGKSTLLKVLSRITEPTTGRVSIHGRIASLLEVGTGFHPELTGRENIFLNGSILGMSQKEIKRKFDEIVDFSGVETFLDTPVKRYSSGMRMRLGFAVAAHLAGPLLGALAGLLPGASARADTPNLDMWWWGEQELPGETEGIVYEDKQAVWHQELSSGDDRPATRVRDAE